MAASCHGNATTARRLPISRTMISAARSRSTRNGCGPLAASVIGVFTKPGRTSVTATPTLWRSARKLSRKLLRNAFVAEYIALPGKPRYCARLEIPTRWPRFRSQRRGRMASRVATAPSRLTAAPARKSSHVRSPDQRSTFGSRVGDDQIDPAHVVVGSAHRLPDLVGLRDIEQIGSGVPAVGVDRTSERFQRLGSAIGERDLDARARQLASERGAQSARGAGDECGPVVHGDVGTVPCLASVAHPHLQPANGMMVAW